VVNMQAIEGDVVSTGQNGHVDNLGVAIPPEQTDIFTTDEEVIVALPDTPYKVALRRELDWGEQLELESAALRGIEREQLEDAASGKQTIILDIRKQRLLMLAIRIRRWNVKRFNPVTKEMEPVRLPSHISERIDVMRRLKPKWARVLIDKVEELDKENAGAEPAMPELIAPSGEDESPPKAMLNGDTEPLTEM
jgi:hypothetical protein